MRRHASASSEVAASRGKVTLHQSEAALQRPLSAHGVIALQGGAQKREWLSKSRAEGVVALNLMLWSRAVGNRICGHAGCPAREVYSSRVIVPLGSTPLTSDYIGRRTKGALTPSELRLKGAGDAPGVADSSGPAADTADPQTTRGTEVLSSRCWAIPPRLWM